MSKIDKLYIKIYTDGACSGNPGAGGWAALLLISKNKDLFLSDNKDIKVKKILLKGGQKHTTNNRMELIAVIKALDFIVKNFSEYQHNIQLYSDSSYVINSINNNWLFNWVKNGWQTSRGIEVANKDLWEELLVLDEFDNVLSTTTFIKVKGHSGDTYNEYVDKIAVAESNEYKKLEIT